MTGGRFDSREGWLKRSLSCSCLRNVIAIGGSAAPAVDICHRIRWCSYCCYQKASVKGL